MAKEGPGFSRKLTHGQVREKCDVNLLVELPKDSPYPVLSEVQNGVGRANLALIFPASGGRDGYCALLSERESLLKLAQDIQSYFGESFQDKTLERLDRIEHLLVEQQKKS